MKRVCLVLFYQRSCLCQNMINLQIVAQQLHLNFVVFCCFFLKIIYIAGEEHVSENIYKLFFLH